MKRTDLPRWAGGLTEYSSSVWIGVVAGLRSMTAPAVTSRTLARSGFDETEPRWIATLSRPEIARWLAFAAAGELLVDKLPIAPNRTVPPSLLWRIASGAACGAAVAHLSGGNLRSGALAGGAGAVIGSYTGQNIRRMIGQILGVPDVLVAVAEDAVATLAAYSVVRTLEPPRQLERIPA
ncbi:MAG TPA: hypothetical protein VMU24_07095 [Candidatus Acidoferrales bacterium]|nr:hypothetical protein [Candidatus Acidoferrales bacterium]